MIFSIWIADVSFSVNFRPIHCRLVTRELYIFVYYRETSDFSRQTFNLFSHGVYLSSRYCKL